MIVAYVGMGLPTAALGVAWKSMRVDFNRPLSSLGVVVVTFTVGYLLATSTHRWTATRLAAPWLLVGASALAAAGAATFALTGSWFVLLGGAALLGLSAGTVDAALNAQVALHHSGRMMNLMHGGFGLGATLGPLLITALIGWGISWRWGYGALGVLQLALVAGFALSAPRWPSPSRDRPSPIIATELGEIEVVDLALLKLGPDREGPGRERVQGRAARLGPLVFLAYGAAEFAIGSWAFVLLTGRGLTTTAAGVCVTLYWGALAVGRLGLGAAGTRLSPAQVLAGSVVGVMAGGVGLWVLPSLGAAVALVALGLSLAGMFPALMALTPGRVGPARTPGVISNQLAAAVIGGAAWGATVGIVAQHLGSAAIAPALLAACGFLAVTELTLSASTTWAPDTALRCQRRRGGTRPAAHLVARSPLARGNLVGQAARIGSRRLTVSLVGVVAVLTLLAVGCASSTTSGGTTAATNPKAAQNGTNITVANPGAPKPGGTLKFGLNAETNGWSPVSDEWAGSAYIVAGAIFDHLAEYNNKEQPTPYLAESITSNPAFTVWTIKMRSGVLFQDGEKCDASAVAANFNAQRASALTGPVFQTVSDVKVVDDLTVQLTMNQPWSTFVNTLTTQPGAMAAPQAMLAQKDGGATHPVGTGPFTFDSWVPNSKLVVKKNPTYWRKGFPYLDGIEFDVQTDVGTRTGALLTGSDDAIEQGDPGQIKTLAADAEAGKVQFYTDSGLYQTEAFQAFNTAVPPFNDILARQIVAYGTDRVNLVKAPFQGVFTPATGPFGPGEPFYAPDAGDPAFDLAKAQALEKQYEAKYGHPLSFSMIVTPQQTVQATGAFLQQGMAQVGAKMSLRPEDQVTLIQDVILGNYQSTAFELFGAVTLDTQFVFISNTTIKPVGGLSLNFSRLNDPVLSQAMTDARKTGDVQQQIAAYKIVQQQMAKNLMFVFWAHLLQSIAYANAVHGLTGYKLPNGETALTQIVPLTFATWKS